MPKPNFDENKYAALLTVPENLVDLSLLKNLAQANGFIPKDEFHITIIGFGTGKKIQEALLQFPQAQQKNIASLIKNLINTISWDFTFKPEYYHLTKEYVQPKLNLKEHRESYIQMLDLPAMQTFYRKLNEFLPLSLETQVPHITLYTKGSDPQKSKMGIGINSQKDFLELKPKPIKMASFPSPISERDRVR